jgi:hypothetical protein
MLTHLPYSTKIPWHEQDEPRSKFHYYRKIPSHSPPTEPCGRAAPIQDLGYNCPTSNMDDVQSYIFSFAEHEGDITEEIINQI